MLTYADDSFLSMHLLHTGIHIIVLPSSVPPSVPASVPPSVALDSSEKQCARELVAGEALECRGFESPSSICILKKQKSLISQLKSAVQTPAAEAARESASSALGAQVKKDRSLSSPLKSAAQTPAEAIEAAEATRERARCALGVPVGAVAAQTNAPPAADAVTSVRASFERSKEGYTKGP
jgi:hypothetical protein